MSICVKRRGASSDEAADIYRRLAVIQAHDPTVHKPAAETDPDFRLTYNVWKPASSTYKKSNPGPPDFRIAVVDARKTKMPTLAQLAALLDQTPYEPPQGTQLYQKLRAGYKSVILAVVDRGVTSYLRIADAALAREKLYERKPKAPQHKNSGGGKGKRRK